MKINGKDVKLRIDIGGMKEFKEKTGTSFLKLGQTDMDEEMLSQMILIFARRGGSAITMEDVDLATASELMMMQDEVGRLMESETKAKNPQQVSRQK